MHARARIGAVWEVERYDRASGLYLGTLRGGNTVTNAGIALFLDIVRGASTNFLNNSLELRIFESAGAGSPIKTISTTDSGYPQTTGTARQLRWQWSDVSIDTYTAHTLKLYRSATEFSVASPAFGTKPNSENWIYRYTLTISGGANFSEPVSFGAGSQYPGLENMLHRAAGLTGGKSWEQNTVAARVYTAAGYGNLLGSQIQNPTVSRTNQTLSYVFVSPAGNHTGSWAWVAVVNWLDSDTFLRIENHNYGSKPSNANWQWTYSLTLSSS